jgi:hypothetical protein
VAWSGDRATTLTAHETPASTGPDSLIILGALVAQIKEHADQGNEEDEHDDHERPRLIKRFLPDQLPSPMPRHKFFLPGDKTN